MVQPDLSKFKGGWNRSPSSIAGDGLDVDGALLGDLQAVAMLLLEVTDDVKRETILCR
jgi:hypothetical protein